MTSIFFVRHAQPEHSWEDDKTRPLTQEGIEDCKKVTEFFRNIDVHCFYSSPYNRSIETIKMSAFENKLNIHTDDRFRERQKGIDGNNRGMFEKRWNDFDFCEEGGESLGTVQNRNIKALFDILNNHQEKNIVLGTHGTALSTILNYFDPSYGCKNFLRIIDFMPYVIRLDFEGTKCVGKEELLIVEKEFKGSMRADKNKLK